MELAVEQHCEEKSKVQTKMENVMQENDRLLTQALSVKIINIVVRDNVKSKDTLSSNASALTFAELFEINELKAKVQAKDTVILNLKEKLNSFNGDVKDRDEKVLVITTLKEQLDKIKGKTVITEAVSLNSINPKLLKVDVTPVVLKLRKNRMAHLDYIRHT
nr:hypothetical protein [Tanacetum cinerariifolium]